MAYETFVPKKFQAHNAALIGTMNAILDDYNRMGYVLTLRQLYYQLVARNVVPNNDNSYDRVGVVLSDARLAGLSDWEMIEDRVRPLRSLDHWNKPSDAAEEMAEQFRIQRWSDQPWHVEIMIEKDALASIVDRIAARLDVPFTTNRGYSSTSALYVTGERMRAHMDAGKDICVIYLGDHDPSGLDMSRDIEDRVGLFSRKKLYEPGEEGEESRLVDNPAYYDRQVIIERVALNYDQILQFAPPPNPTKPKDSRTNGYVAKFGFVCWELDALRPDILEGLIEKKILEYRDDELWEAATSRQEELRERLTRVLPCIAAGEQ